MNVGSRIFRLTHVVGATLALVVASAGLTLLDAQPASALGAGEVCVFLQPQGGDIPIAGTVGHIGWGFLVGGTTTWTFGSTENPNGDNPIKGPAFNGAWSASGSYQQMIDAFTFQNHFPAASKRPEPAHPYTEFKCRTTATSSVGAANQAVATNKNSGYDGTGNNCLDAVYHVLSAYGVPGLPSPAAMLYPNAWFSVLSDPWWPGNLGETWDNVNSGMALDLDHGGTANGTIVHQWPVNFTSAQYWVRTITAGGSYELFSWLTGKCVGVGGGSLAQGAPVVEWDCNGSNDQRWFWRATGSYVGSWPVYNLVNLKSNLCLGITGGSFAQGAVAVQWSCNGNPDQDWY